MNKQSYHGYYKKGDVVKDKEVWGDELFLVEDFGGNAYLPVLHVRFINKKREMSLPTQTTTLINSGNRPLKKMKTRILIKMLKKGIEEAKREFIIRNTK